mmetsp:Transcript_16756/g.28418  ORF Transcript_16756/g.28418 Transcript_16756/m.28418 type:complete len:300 (-) Transcript_16756:72-971(-)
MSALDFAAILKKERNNLKQKVRAEALPDATLEAVSSKQGNLVNNTDMGDRDGKVHTALKLPLVLTPNNTFCLESCRVGELEGIFYIPNCIDESTENALQELVDRSSSWKQLKTRRLQCWGSFPSDHKDENGYQLTAAMPDWLDTIIDELVRIGVFDNFSDTTGNTDPCRPNNVLINQYSPCQGIIHHTDGPLYRDRVAVISLGSDCILSFRKKLTASEIGSEGVFAGDVCSLVLRRRSLMIFEREAYTDYMHGINFDHPVEVVGSSGTCINESLAQCHPGMEIKRCIRTSLTFRILRNM